MSSSYKSLIVKQVLSGDCLVLRDRSKSGPPPEKVIALSNIIAPRLAKRNNDNTVESTLDEPYAWESREFIRQLCIGQEVWYQTENKSPTGREYANVYLGNNFNDKTNLAELIVEAGLAEVRKQTGAVSNEQYQKLLALEEAAKAGHKGKWNTTDPSLSVRNIVWNIDNPVKFVQANQNRIVPAIIEHVRDGSTVRAVLLPDEIDTSFRYVTVMLSGVRTPSFKMGDNSESVPEPFAEEARFFIESKLLQRRVDVRLETANNLSVVGTVIHPRGNIAELILKEGFGKIVDWSMGVLEQKTAICYRTAERQAKEKRLRIWKDYEPAKLITELGSSNGSMRGLELNDQSLVGKVLEVGNGDNITVRCANGETRKFFLSSIRAPKLAPVIGDGSNVQQQKKIKPLYDIPYLFEAREFLRKKLIGKKVTIRVDYIQPKTDNLEERIMATVMVGEMNVSEALVLKGLATVVRYRASDENRSLYYDALLLAESTAQKKSVGVHSKKEAPSHKISDLSGEPNKARQFFSSLKRHGKMSGVVEFVASGSRLRVYVAKETCILTVLCAGIDCPRGSRRLPTGKVEPADPFGNEAMEFTRELCMQREVEIEIDNMDKGGNFIGWVYLDTTELSSSTTAGSIIGSSSNYSNNLSVALVEAGLARVHFTAERSTFFKQLCDAETRAKDQRLHIWTVEGELSYTEQNLKQASDNQNLVQLDQLTDRKVNFKSAFVTRVVSGTHFYAQLMENENIIVNITKELRNHFTEHPHVPGGYRAKKGDLCAAKFSLDGCWYRAKVLKVDSAKAVHLLYVDFGNEEINEESCLSTLPSNLLKIPFQAKEYSLACLMNPPDEEAQDIAKYALENDIADKEVKLNVEYESSTESGGSFGATVLVKVNDGKWENEAELLLRDGIVFVDEKRKERRLGELMKQFLVAQEEARLKRLNIWKYGDFRNDDGPL